MPEKKIERLESIDLNWVNLNLVVSLFSHIAFNLLGQRERAFSVGHVDLAKRTAVFATVRCFAAGQFLLKIRSQLISWG